MSHEVQAPTEPKAPWARLLAYTDDPANPSDDELVVYRGLISARTKELGLGRVFAPGDPFSPYEGEDYRMEIPHDHWCTSRRQTAWKLLLQLEVEFQHLRKLRPGSDEFERQLEYLKGPEGEGWSYYVVEGVLSTSGLTEEELVDAMDEGEAVERLRWIEVLHLDPEQLDADFGTKVD